MIKNFLDLSSLDSSWQECLKDEFTKPYFIHLNQLLENECASGKLIHPTPNLIFNAFNCTPLNQLKVVLLGQDPYHQPNQAMGLSFSVPKGVKVPASLRNVYKELSRTVDGFSVPNHGDLSGWANQGVLMLNTALTVEAGKAGSHAKIGWQIFTDAVIQIISERSDGVVFLLWGKFAHKKSELINLKKHCVLKAIHPSPLARGGFSGCNHFFLVNRWLEQRGKSTINWQV